MSRKAAIGAVWSMLSDPSPSGSGGSSRSLPNVASSNTRAWWDVHRHRMAPEVETRITQALAAGRLALIAARVTGIEPNAGGALVRYRRRGQSEITSLHVRTIVDCTGIVKDPHATTNPVVRSLLDKGLAKVDPLHIGIEIDTDCAIINRDGLPSRRLFAVGPFTRAAFWEIIAIPTFAINAPRWPRISFTATQKHRQRASSMARPIIRCAGSKPRASVMWRWDR